MNSNGKLKFKNLLFIYSCFLYIITISLIFINSSEAYTVFRLAVFTCPLGGLVFHLFLYIILELDVAEED